VKPAYIRGDRSRFILRTHSAMMPSNPMPNSTSETGSGTGLMVREPYRPGGMGEVGLEFGSRRVRPECCSHTTPAGTAR
jgi:hypothetical protein